MEIFYLFLELPKTLLGLPIGFALRKTFSSDQILALRCAIPLPYDSIRQDALDLSIIRGFCPKWRPIRLPTIRIFLINLEMFEHTYVEHRMYLEFWW